MKISIFGGGGFIGSAVADRLLRDGHELRIFERPRVAPYREFAGHERVEWIGGDLLSLHDVSGAVAGADVVVHLVSTTLPGSSNEDPVYDVQSNLTATLQMLQAMVAHRVRKIVFISSGGTVYGNPVYLPIDEQHPTDPLVSYGIVKLAIEKYLLMFRHYHDLKAVILRVANPYGERQRVETAQGAATTFIHRAVHDRPIDIWGDGHVTRDYLYVGDVAEAFARAIAYEGATSVFNIGSGAGTSLNDLLDLLEEVLGRKVGRRYGPSRAFDVPASVLDSALARQELDWAPQIDLKTGIAKTIAWMQAQLPRQGTTACKNS